MNSDFGSVGSVMFKQCLCHITSSEAQTETQTRTQTQLDQGFCVQNPAAVRDVELQVVSDGRRRETVENCSGFLCL